MRALSLNEIRESFLAFFEGKGHLRLPSFSLVPMNDKSLLLINAGMAPLKTYFTGQETPPRKRLATCQKCVRTGDIDSVGKDQRHCTFFEMLGNFSFGDYFKEEIISWSWEFVTQVLEMPADRLYVSVYREDEEAFALWTQKIGLPVSRVIRMGKEDNFWEHGVGPCGPCSEIYYDRGEKYGCEKASCGIGCDCDRYVEFWNLVFTQFNKGEDGRYTPLAFPNIDTGMGLERIAAILQDAESVFDVDAIRAVRDRVRKIADADAYPDSRPGNRLDNRPESVYIITDHIRSVVFMTADGIMPSNEGRGYVLRRLLRRAARHGKLLGIDKPFLSDLSQVVIAVSQGAYPELLEKKEYIEKMISVEENRFYETLDQGLDILRGHMTAMREKERVLPGKIAFQLYDTFGFPPDLMREILAEEGMTLHEDDFQREMERQRERARAAREESTYMGAEETAYHQLPVDLKTEFVGYTCQEANGVKIAALIAHHQLADRIEPADGDVSVILDKTPFYAESGGQTGDQGWIRTKTGRVNVYDCVKVIGGKTVHLGKVTEGFLQAGSEAVAEVGAERRLATRRNHSATHLLQKALREIFGAHVEQAGSRVSAERLRFDFTHFAPLSPEDLRRTEEIVNTKILDGLPITVTEKTLDEARKMGAMALFGEKYGDVVRVVDMDGYSVELCGGTHLTNTAQIGSFKIISESGVAAGVRRIEAVTGRAALSFYRETEESLRTLGDVLKGSPDNLLRRARALMDELRDLREERNKMNAKLAGGMVEGILARREEIKGFPAAAARVDGLDMNGLREICDKARDKINGILLLASVKDGKGFFLASASREAVEAGVHAGELVKEAAAICGGGGGKPNMAQAGCKDVSKIDVALDAQKKLLEKQIH
ncbi:MAG: alanine--tRNA ligase [Clostridiales bacterium]|jgi:alanyl-tRNA synthetase|nr:alanine--tRNA ligase [Clostridiales bacterium]